MSKTIEPNTDRCRKVIYVYKCGIIKTHEIDRCTAHLDLTKWPCQQPKRVIQYLSTNCTGGTVDMRNHDADTNHRHRPPQSVQGVERADFESYFDYLAAKWQVAGHCRQVCYRNSACGQIHFYALDCRRKRARPRRDQSCCGKREWVLDRADEKCKHPECVRSKKNMPHTWRLKFTNVFSCARPR